MAEFLKFSSLEIRIIFLFVFVFNINLCNIINLNGKWNISNARGQYNLTGEVPGTIYTDLLRKEILDDPLFRFNDVEYRWVARENWTYFRTFNVSSNELHSSSVVLVCDGLDTVAEIRVNGKLIGKSINMFVRYVFDIKDVLKEGVNEVNISFESPLSYAAGKFKAHTNYTVPPVCSTPEQKGECYRNYIRKEQASFSWDWGPAFPTMGIWKNISIQVYNSVVIRDVLVITSKGNKDNPWQLRVTIFADVAPDYISSPTDVLKISFSQIPLSWKQNVNYKPGQQEVNVFLNVSKNISIDTWWPNGFGKPALYDMDVVFSSGTYNETSSKRIRIGFRTVELVEEEIGNDTGLSFYFKVNSLPIFLKGSNWIPADSFKERVSSDYLSWLLQSSVDANMNALRVWGGGVYESEEFYNLADELGILIWQDLMFACSMYPVDSEFLETVQEEVKHQIRRLQYHPSVIAWAGNNENEAALVGNWYNTKNQFELYKKDYITLYINTIRPIVQSIDPSRPYISSSPSNGKETEEEGWVAKNPSDSLYGDVHVYNYMSDGWNWTIYPRSRFTSEYGFQSWPSFETLQKVSIEEDWHLNSKFLRSRQHHLLGDMQMLFEISNHFKLPQPQTSITSFKGNIYLSQINQAESIKTETECYRRSQTELIDGYGKTMGALYWQLNDIWQAPSWASIEYGGKWKMLHYYAVNFFSPVLVSPYIDKGIFKVSTISDLTSPTNLSLTLEVYRWSSFTPLQMLNANFSQPPQTSQVIFSSSFSDLLLKAGCPNQESCFIYLTLVNSENMQVGPNNYYFPAAFTKVIGLEKPHLQFTSVKKLSSRNFSMSLKTSGISPFTWLEATGIAGRFSDNGFLLVHPEINLTFYARQDVTEDVFHKSLTVQSLLDIYYPSDMDNNAFL